MKIESLEITVIFVGKVNNKRMFKFQYNGNDLINNTNYKL